MSNDNTTTHVLNAPAQSATKELKKRGRKGNNIAQAFKEVPSTPVNFEEYAKSHNVSTKVLRQIKRHDRYVETGKVFVRKNKQTKTMMIWREPAEK